MNNMEPIHINMSTHVVTIIVGGGKKTKKYDGTVLSSHLECLYVIASSEFRDEIDNTLIQIWLPNNRLIPIGQDCFDLAPKNEDTGIVGIRCANPTPGVECGFGDLIPIDVCYDVVQEEEKIYTYSRHHRQKLLTPGSIMLVEEDSFDHDCVRYLNTHKGAPVINVRGQYVGFCFSHNGYLTSYNIREVAARIERNQGRPVTRPSVTFHHLRQQGSVIDYYLRAGVFYVKIQWIGQPVNSATWENLDEFQQQHPTFEVEEEIRQRIELAREDPMKGLQYVRRAKQGYYVRLARLGR